MGRWVTVGLFSETAGPNKDFIIMSLDEACERFVECNDPTGYVFAKQYLGGYKHWKALLSSPVMADHIEIWLEELELKLRCESVKRIIKTAEKGHFQANKCLVDRGWDNRKAGRPSKEEVERHTKREERFKASVDHFLKPVHKD